MCRRRKPADYDKAPVWAQSMYDALVAKIGAIATSEGKIMAAVQIDDAVLGGVVTALENLATAVVTFTTNNPGIPAADLAPLNQALADAQTAQTDLAAAGPAPAPTPAPDSPPATP